MKTILFDVDNTLYPEEINLFKEVDERINQYLEIFCKIDKNHTNIIRKIYLDKYGTTLNGLIKHYNIDPIHYLEYVHNIQIENYLKVNENLKKFFKKSPFQHIIFSNAYLPYIEKILKILEIENYFKEIFDITRLNYIPKPYKEAYLYICKSTKIEPDNSILIDDSSKNLITAKKLGFKTIYISSNKNSNFDLNLKKIDDIEFFLEKLVDF